MSILTAKTFKCTKCGECCRPIVKLSKEDITSIEEIGKKEFFVYDENIKSNVLKQVNYRCMFLKKEGDEYLCSIYNNRPEVCRKYPFITGEEKLENCYPRGWKRWRKIEELFNS